MVGKKVSKRVSGKEMTSSGSSVKADSCCCTGKKKHLIKWVIKDVVIVSALVLSVISLVMSSGQNNIEKWIDKNPQKVIDSLNKYVMELQKKESEERKSQVKEMLPQVKKEIMNDRSVPYAGNMKAKGDNVVIEFFDYNCGHCKVVSKVVDQLVKEEQEVKVLLVELPIFGGPSTTAAKVVLAVKKMYPNKVYDVHQALMNGNARTEDGIYEAVKSAGVNVASIKSGVEKYSDEINAQLQKYREYAMKLGINGTPAFIIGDELIPGAIDIKQMKEYIEKSRK